MKPRIYTYKITFPHQGWWYWGVHKEKTFGDSYDGTPKTHAEKWENFEFEKQILEFFDDWDVARSVEKRLIDPDLNNPMCLNENSNGGFSLAASSKGGQTQSREDKVKGGRNGNREGKSRGGRNSGRNNVESGHLASIRSKGGKIRAKKLNSQKWKCLVTGHISNPGALSGYQKARGIDTSLREKVE